MRSIYCGLLRLYPYDFRAAFEGEMLRALGQSAVTEVAGLLRGAATEWWAKLTTDKNVRGRALPDLRMMRPAGVTQEEWFWRRACSPGILR